jgi:ABC-type multidrug transport system ATPase subunit/ABC-type antimicrobial peptide transport system permease subunit
MELQGGKADPAAISELFTKLGIPELVNRYPNQCSVGQCQRAAIARTLIKKPKIVIADEPTSSVDPETRIEIFTLLREISKDVLVVASTHNRDMIERFADRVLMMANGKITEDRITGGENCNIEVFDKGKVIAVEPGSILTGTDIDTVNDIISKNNKKGVFLVFETDPARVQSINPNVAKDMVSATLKEKQAKKAREEKAKIEKIENMQESGVFQFEKAKLPVKSAFRLSMVNFTSNRVRSVFTVVLSFLAIMFFMLTTSLARVDVNKLIINTFARGDDPYIIYSSNERLFNLNSDANQHHERDKFGVNMGAWTLNGSADKSGLVYDFGKMSMSAAPEHAQQGGKETTIYGVRKLIVEDTSTGNTNKFGVNLLAGRWANSNDSDEKSIVISDFVATQIRTAAFIKDPTTVPSFADMVNPENVLGQNKILIDGVNEFTIIGIYETNFRDYFVMNYNDTRFLQVFPISLDSFKADAMRINPGLKRGDRLRAEFLIQNDFVTGFVSSKFISKGFAQGPSREFFEFDQSESDYFMTQHLYGARDRDLTEKIDNNGITFVNNKNFFAGFESITPGVIRVSEKFYKAFIDADATVANSGGVLTVSPLVPQVYEFKAAKVAQTYSIVRDWTEADSGAHRIANDPAAHVYHILAEFKFEIDTTLLSADFDGYAIQLAATDFERVIQSLVMPSMSFAVAGSYSASTLRTVFGKMGNDVTPSYADSVIITEHAGSYSSLSNALVTASVAYAIFVIALMYNYIFQSIRSKRKSIAVIRSMGARTFDIFKIFLLEALIISALICLGAFMSVGIATALGNAIVSASSGIALSIFALNAGFLFLMLIGAVLVIFTSYMLPVFRYARHRKHKGLVKNLNVRSDN